MTQNKFMMLIYRASLFMLVLTGFGQMPIFKRYYIADIPGFGWLAEFYTTHFLHYLSAIFFIISITYFGALYLNESRRPDIKLVIKGILFLTLTISGFLLVLRNFPGYRFTALFITMTDLVHLASVVLLFVFWGGWFIIKKKKNSEEIKNE